MTKHNPHDTTKVTHENRLPGRAPDKHDADGNEIGDPTPMEPPLGYRKSLTLSEQIQQQVRVQLLKRLEDEMSSETEDDADDFEVGEDYEPLSKYENEHMPTLSNLKKRAKEINDQIEKRKLELSIKDHKDRIAAHKAKATPPIATSSDPDLTPDQSAG